MVLTDKVVEDCVAKMQADDTLKGLVVPEESFGHGFWTQCKKLERKFYEGVDWMEAARFFDRKTFDEFSGYDEDNTGTEDYDLPLRIKHQYGEDSISRSAEYILHNEQRLAFKRTCAKKFYYAQKLDVYKNKLSNQATFKKQANPLHRYRLFFSKPKLLLRRPHHGLGMLVLKTSELIAGASGALYGKMSKSKPETNIYG